MNRQYSIGPVFQDAEQIDIQFIVSMKESVATRPSDRLCYLVEFFSVDSMHLTEAGAIMAVKKKRKGENPGKYLCADHAVSLRRTTKSLARRLYKLHRGFYRVDLEAADENQFDLNAGKLSSHLDAQRVFAFIA